MKQLIVIFLCLFSITSIFSQENVEWKLKHNKNGTTLHTRFPEVKNKKGKKETVFEWKINSTQTISFENCKNAIKNVNNHKKFYDCKESKVLNEINNETVAYYLFDAPWPMSDMDLIRTITHSENENIFISKHISSPEKMKLNDEKRVEISEIIYKIKKINDEKVEIEIIGKFIPVGVPDFLAKSWFPKGPLKVLEELTKASK
ncbi:SRPBCC family protein [Aureivirga marina]|uniref:hypothetical protein n=1 Tax=Aureivirga marina TaxID=1182451 RepID=UPI0018C9D12F|nr:hypothetical protein [Aureivirga marina]